MGHWVENGTGVQTQRRGWKLGRRETYPQCKNTGHSNRRNRGRSHDSHHITNLHRQLRLALLLSYLLMVFNSRTMSYRRQTHSSSPFVQLAGAHRNQVTSATNVFKRDTGNQDALLGSAALRSLLKMKLIISIYSVLTCLINVTIILSYWKSIFKCLMKLIFVV